MTDMLERVARAIYEVRPALWAVEDPCRVEPVYEEMDWEMAKERGVHFEAMEQARAAIAAMRNCTPKMLDAGSAAHPAGGYKRETLLNDIIECEWRAMIDAALTG